jgi:hypothetical protein
VAKHKIIPRLVGKSYRADFRHPAHGGSICRGLGAKKTFADATCYVLNLICNDNEICQAEIGAVPDAKLRELGCSKAAKKALEIFFGPHPKIDALFKKREGLTDADFEEIQALAEKWNAEELQDQAALKEARVAFEQAWVIALDAHTRCGSVGSGGRASRSRRNATHWKRPLHWAASWPRCSTPKALSKASPPV